LRIGSILLAVCSLLGRTPAYAEAPAPTATERELRKLFASCLAGTDTCESVGYSYQRFEALGREAGAEALPLLWRLDARDALGAGSARQAIQTRLMAKALVTRPCAPPASEEVARERARLSDFATLDVRGGKLVAVPPTPEQIEDLAYFLVAVREAGPPVGKTQEPGGDWRRPAPVNDSLDAAYEELVTARFRGDLHGMDAAARRYLVLLGYPAPLRASEENTYGWHGARFAEVMLEWAAVKEDLRAFEDSAALYRRVDPGGGACGTGRDAAMDELIRGTIRATEQHQGCLGVVVERLQNVDVTVLAISQAESPYGPARLREAGFDVERLYRGARVTRHRDMAPEELERVLSAAPEPLRTEALRRLQERGPEAWDKRVRSPH
jgi:hypothetical protein